MASQDLPELKALIASVNEGRETPVSFGYEAAVCGGIPIIHALQVRSHPRPHACLGPATHRAARRGASSSSTVGFRRLTARFPGR